MKIPVNPSFDLETLDPHENEFAYVNPVALNNRLIVLANESIELAALRASAERELTRLRLDKRKAEQQLEDAEEKLLRDEPLAPSEAKSNKTIAAAVARRALEAGKEAWFEKTRAAMRAYDDEIEKQLYTATTSRIYMDAAEQASENIKNHLSFVKSEQDKSRRHGHFGA